MTAPVDLNRVDGALARGDVVAPEVWNGLDSVIAGMPFFASKRASESIGVKISANTASNRASIESDMADVATAPSPPPQVQIDPSPLTDDEIAYGQRIANDPAMWNEGMVYHAPDDLQENQITVISPQFEPSISVAADRVGETVKKSAAKSNASNKSSNRNVKRNPKAVQQVIDYLMRNPDDIGLKVAELTDKLKYDVRMKVGHSSVGKALSIMKTNGKEKAS